MISEGTLGLVAVIAFVALFVAILASIVVPYATSILDKLPT